MASLEAVKKTQVLTVKFLQEFATFLAEYKHASPEGDVYYKPAVCLQYLSKAKTVLENQFKDSRQESN